MAPTIKTISSLLLLLAANSVARTDILMNYRICLTDASRENSTNLSNTSCEYTEKKDGYKNVRCEWTSGNTFLKIIYMVPETQINSTSNWKVNCSFAMRIDISRHPGNVFSAGLNPSVGLPRLLEAQKFLDWRQWIVLTSPTWISITNSSSQTFPSFKNFTRLRSFTIQNTPRITLNKILHSMGSTDHLIFPELPPSIKSISLTNDTLFDMPSPGNNSFIKLRVLDLSYNLLNSHCFDNLLSPFAPNLERLNLSRNNLKSLGPHFSVIFPKLKWLDLSQNRIKDFNSTQPLPRSLNFLNISHNYGSWNQFMYNVSEQLPLLESLDVSYGKNVLRHNEITWEIKAHLKLKSLHISGCKRAQIANLDIDYLRMKMYYYDFPLLLNSSIRYLDVSNGSIQYIPNLGLNNTSVDFLNISHNKISDWEVDSIFLYKNGTSWVKHVNLSYNHISFMSPPMLASLETLKTVDIGENPFNCNNCSIFSFQTWLKENAGIVSSLNKSRASPHCSSSPTEKAILVSKSDIHLTYCQFDARVIVGTTVGLFFVIFVLCVLYFNRCHDTCSRRIRRLWMRKPYHASSTSYVNLLETS